MAESLFDPFAYIKSHGGLVRIDDGQIIVTFARATREPCEACHIMLPGAMSVCQAPTDVELGEMPRTVQQIVWRSLSTTPWASILGFWIVTAAQNRGEHRIIAEPFRRIWTAVIFVTGLLARLAALDAVVLSARR